MDPAALKRYTERAAYAAARRLGERRVLIKSSFHESVTDHSTGQTRVDDCHCTLKVWGNMATIHIYVDRQDVAMELLNPIGEGILRRGWGGLDRRLSTETVPFNGVDWTFD
ncbi:unnamed protein product [Penicillium bialowiezense]